MKRLSEAVETLIEFTKEMWGLLVTLEILATLLFFGFRVLFPNEEASELIVLPILYGVILFCWLGAWVVAWIMGDI